VTGRPASASATAGSARRAGSIWLAGALAAAAFVLLPLLALVSQAVRSPLDHLGGLATTILPSALWSTLVLLAGVGLIAAAVGTVAAWLVTAHDFPGRGVVSWALLLPLAMPTYIIAYAYLDILHPIGPVQSLLRGLLGYSSPREFRLPDIRSMTGCIVLLGFALYPYVYIPVRAMFLTQSAGLVEASRTLGVGRRAVFRRVALPLARPAVAVGVSLALMETLNDIGAAEFLGVRTLTVSIYTTWVTRADLPAAAQIALALLFVVVLLVALERWARRSQRFATAGGRAMQPRRAGPLAGAGLLTLALLPVLIGFAAPALYLVHAAWTRYRFAGVSPRLIGEAANTIVLAASATAITVALGLVVAYALRLRPGRTAASAYRLATVGYAAPGTVIAIGMLIVLGLADRTIDGAARALSGASVGLVFLGSGVAVVLAYVARFLTIPAGAVEAGLARIPASLDQAARTLGRTATGTFWRVHLPLSRPALAAGALLVFVDCVKELPATLLLRPLNVETLATHLYGEAARGTYEEAAIAALAIVVIAMLPVVLLSKVGVPRRQPAGRARAAASG